MRRRYFVLTMLLVVLLPVLVFSQYPMKVGDWPVVKIAVSEYPSWSTYFVAHMLGLIDSREGLVGPVENDWHADIVVVEAEYDPCITAYANGQCPAVCITNMDILNPSLRVPAVAILPTSTSYGADKCIVTSDVNDIRQLKQVKNYMLRASVSEYLNVRFIEDRGENPREYQLENMDPGTAALAMQQKQSGISAITVWNPFCLSTLQKRSDVHVLFDSQSIPGEIIDMVVVSQELLDSPDGENCACALIDAFYQVNEVLANPKTHDKALIGIGKKFSNFDLASMEIVVKETVFYGTPEFGIPIYSGGNVFPFEPGKTRDTLQDVMKKVVRFCMDNGVIDTAKYPNPPTIGYGAKGTKSVNLRFDPTYMQRVMAKK